MGTANAGIACGDDGVGTSGLDAWLAVYLGWGITVTEGRADILGAGTALALAAMSKTITHRPVGARRRFRLGAALLLVLTACAVAGIAASPAAASPPVGTAYCMDGSQTFATWDALSANVTNVLVTSFGGVLTLGEVDPANVGRDAVRQYYDALETSDAIGSPGIDTTIPNYAVHHITAGACPYTPAENHVFLCYSKFQVDPGVWPVSQAQALLQSGYWEPSALSGTTAGGTNLGAFHLVCNPPASMKPSGSSIGGDGTANDGANVGDDPGYYPSLG